MADPTEQECVYSGGSLSNAGAFYARRLLTIGFSSRTTEELSVVLQRYPQIEACSLADLFSLVPRSDLLWWLSYLGSLLSPGETEKLVDAAAIQTIH